MDRLELHANLPHHPKTAELAGLLGVGVAQAVGHLVCLWAWAIHQQPDGDLSALTSEAIAGAAGYEGDADALVTALVAAGWLDDGEGWLAIHDWDAHTGKLVRRAEAEALRLREYRVRKRGDQPRRAPGRPRKATPSTTVDAPSTTVDAEVPPVEAKATKAKKPREPKVYTDEVKELVAYMAETVERHLGEKPLVKAAWLDDMDKLLRIDGRLAEQVRKAIDFAFRSDFWPSKCMTPGKLRKHYETLRAEARSQKKKGLVAAEAGKTPDGGTSYHNEQIDGFLAMYEGKEQVTT